MRDTITFILAFLVILLQEKDVRATDAQLTQGIPTKLLQFDSLDQNRHNENTYSQEKTKILVRAKRQYTYRDRDRLPIIFGGGGFPPFGTRGYGPRGFGGRGIGGRGFGNRVIGGRGFGSRGIGGRGFGGRGIGGRGVGGRGFGGRGIGGRGIGGRGGIGGGRGGRG